VKFKHALQKGGVTLGLASQMLCHGSRIFINGEAHHPNRNDYPLLRNLADQRMFAGSPDLSPELVATLYQWYLSGYILPI
jgi:50S ribosomal protein L16 3-hydroxylase